MRVEIFDHASDSIHRYSNTVHRQNCTTRRAISRITRAEKTRETSDASTVPIKRLQRPPPASGFLHDSTTQRWLGTAAILSFGMIVGGYLLGNGLMRAKEADRSVTVRGLAERDVTADLATWTHQPIRRPHRSGLCAGQRRQAIRGRSPRSSSELGFPADALQPTGVNVSSYTDDNGVTRLHRAPAHDAAHQRH